MLPSWLRPAASDTSVEGEGEASGTQTRQPSATSTREYSRTIFVRHDQSTELALFQNPFAERAARFTLFGTDLHSGEVTPPAIIFSSISWFGDMRLICRVCWIQKSPTWGHCLRQRMTLDFGNSQSCELIAYKGTTLYDDVNSAFPLFVSGRPIIIERIEKTLSKEGKPILHFRDLSIVVGFRSGSGPLIQDVEEFNRHLNLCVSAPVLLPTIPRERPLPPNPRSP